MYVSFYLGGHKKNKRRGTLWYILRCLNFWDIGKNTQIHVQGHRP